jgi:hypothetical protein
MNDSETRETLIAMGEILKGEFLYLASLHRGFYALFESLKQELPGIEKRYSEAAGWAIDKEYPGTREKIEQLDALLQQLKKR